MFFMMGITDGRKDFDFTQTIICNLCGKYGRYQVFMTYTVLSLFLIPCLKWNKHYYVQTSCCHAPVSYTHLKETEEGRETMCESVKEYAKEYADERDVIKVRKLMENLQLTLEQALNALDIQGTSRTYIEKRLQK